MKKIIVFLVLVLLIGCTDNKASLEKNNVEIDTGSKNANKAPDFTLKNLDDEDISLSSFSGKVIILNFWATWCPPCRMEIPDFIQLNKFYKDRGLAIIGIAIDKEGKEVVKPFVEENKINYPILLVNDTVVSSYGGIRGVPTTFIINRKGEIVKNFIGYTDYKTFENEIRKLL